MRSKARQIVLNNMLPITGWPSSSIQKALNLQRKAGVTGNGPEMMAVNTRNDNAHFDKALPEREPVSIFVCPTQGFSIFSSNVYFCCTNSCCW